MTEPRTEAGRAFLRMWTMEGKPFPGYDFATEHILAIEAEAARPVSGLEDPWLADIVRCGEVSLAHWQEAHRNEETGALTFMGPDGPFYEGIRSVVERLRDYHFAKTHPPRLSGSGREEPGS